MKKQRIKLAPLIAALVLAAAPFGDFSVGTAEAAAFTDVSQSDWFWEDVTSLSEDGVLLGYPDGSFRPHSSVSRAEFIKLLCTTLRLKPKPTVSCDGFADSTQWYSEYICAALEAGILRIDEFPGGKLAPNEVISRAEAARYICRSLDISPLPYASPYGDTDDIYACSLYAELIMVGSMKGRERCFKPESGITRAECSAVIRRISQYSENKTAYKSEQSAEVSVPSADMNSSPETHEEFSLYLMHMVKSGIYDARFVYGDRPFGSDKLTEIKKTYLETFGEIYNRHPEYFSLMSTEVSTSGNSGVGYLNVKLTVIPESGITTDDLARLRVQASGKAKSIVGNIVSTDMTTLEKASAIHDYIVSCTSYDIPQKAKSGYTAYLAYGALVEGSAVCQGYASAFNLLCAESGIRSCAVSNGSHMWNAVLADGSFYVFDTTWDDPVPDVPGKVEKKYCGIPLAKAESDGVHLSKYFDIKYIY